MAVQAALNSRNKERDGSFDIRQQLHDEASKLLSFQALGTRMGQLDSIIKRRADKVYFSMETESANQGNHGNVAENMKKREKLVLELLKKVKKRRKMIRSYTYLSWFCIFFCSFLANLFLKEDNAHLFAVDNSIRNRIVDVLPSGTISNNTAFYDWFDTVVVDVFPDTVCGNGICEGPDEYPGFGRFGCVSDCGRYLQRTPIRIDLLPAWQSKPLALDLPSFVMGAGDNTDVQFSYNIFSETMNDYIFEKDMQQSAIVDVPDGNLWLELYQTGSVFYETPSQDMADYAQVGIGTTNSPKKSFDFQYGDASEAIATAAQINRQLRDYCTIDNDGSAEYSSCPGYYDVNAMGTALRSMYGLSGNISVSKGMTRNNLLSIPFCALTNSNGRQDAALINAGLCKQGSTTIDAGTKASVCYDGNVLAKRFQCQRRFPFSIWAFGPPRNVSVKPAFVPTSKSLTPFNNVIGSVTITQYRRKDTACSASNSAAINVLTGQFTCQALDPGSAPFGVDPVFQASSRLYNGKLRVSDYYRSNEMVMVNGTGDSTGAKAYPFAFFPHQWGVGGLKAPSLISDRNLGLYKLFFDSRFGANQSRNLVQFMRDGMFISDKTAMIELEIITYNADFNLFGILTIQFNWDQGGGTLWDYQYNTAQLSPYSGVRGQITMAFEVIFGIMLVIDIGRESRDIYHAILREEVIQGYVMKFWNWIDWSHYALLGSSLSLWTVYNMFITSLGLKSSYPVARDLSAPCRLFATDPQGEYDFIDFTDKMRKLSEMKNLYTAINCLCITFFIIRILKILDFQPRMSLITRTLRVASVDLSHYLCLFSIIFVGYASVGTLLLGDRVPQFQTFGDSCSELFMIFMGWDPLYREMGKAAGQTKVKASFLAFQIFYWTWVMVASFLMLNMVLAIIVDAYATVKSQMHDAPTIVHEAYTVCREGAQMAANRLWGKEWFIRDAQLERILVNQNRSLQSQKKLLDRVSQIRGRAKSVRLAGGLEVSEQDLVTLLQESGTTGKILLSKAESFVVDGKGQRNFKSEDGVEIEEDIEWKPPPAIENLIKRYGEVVPEGKDDEEFLELIRTENMKRQMAMYTSQDQIRQQVDCVLQILNSVARFALPKGEFENLQTAMLVKRNADGCISLDVGDIISRSKTIEGMLKVTVVSAKRLPKLDIFSESDPYCVLIIEQPSEREDGETSQEPFGRTITMVDDQNPIWNAEFCVSVQCTSSTKLVAALLDKDEHGSDDLIGLVGIVISELPLGKEVDKWYKLRNDAAPHLTKKAMVRIKVQFSATVGTGGSSSELKLKGTENSELSRKSITTGLEVGDELKWLQEKLANVTPAIEKIGAKLLEVTLISARHLPKRDSFFMKIDPYVKLSFNGFEYESIVRKATYSPDWCQSFLFDVKEVSDISDGLHIAVMDWDRFTSHDIVGFVEISKETMVELLSQEQEWYQEQTFCIQRKGKLVVGYDGNRSQVTVGFRVKEPVLSAPNDSSHAENNSLTEHDVLRAEQEQNGEDDLKPITSQNINTDGAVGQNLPVQKLPTARNLNFKSVCYSKLKALRSLSGNDSEMNPSASSQKSTLRSGDEVEEKQSSSEEMFDAPESIEEIVEGSIFAASFSPMEFGLMQTNREVQAQ